MNESDLRDAPLGDVIQVSREYEKYDRLYPDFAREFVLPAFHRELLKLTDDIQSQHLLNTSSSLSSLSCVHYTSIETLFSILQGKITCQRAYLRLYDSIHLNDPDEGRFLLRHIPEDERLLWLRSRLANPGTAYLNSFLASDSDDDNDNLVFWRTYGNEGCGCSISISPPRNKTYRVRYGRDKAADTANGIAQVVIELSPVVSRVSTLDPSLLNEFSISLLKACGSICHLYKSHAYEYENECRYVLSHHDVESADINYEYHQRDDRIPRIRHYINQENLEIDHLLTSGSVVTIGPSVPNRQNVIESLNTLKDRAGLSRITIRPSEISYRSP